MGKAGDEHMKYVDLLIPCAAKFSLIMGKGPLYLVGGHCVEYFNAEAEEAEEDDDVPDCNGTEESIDDSNGEVKSKSSKDSTSSKNEATGGSDQVTPDKDDKKRKSSTEQTKSQEKKPKASPSK